MPEVIQFERRLRSSGRSEYPTIQKIVDGEIINCVNVDELTATQRLKYFAGEDGDARRNTDAAARCQVIRLPG